MRQLHWTLFLTRSKWLIEHLPRYEKCVAIYPLVFLLHEGQHLVQIHMHNDLRNVCTKEREFDHWTPTLGLRFWPILIIKTHGKIYRKYIKNINHSKRKNWSPRELEDTCTCSSGHISEVRFKGFSSNNNRQKCRKFQLVPSLGAPSQQKTWNTLHVETGSTTIVSEMGLMIIRQKRASPVS